MLPNNAIKQYFNDIATQHIDIQHGENGRIRFIQFEQKEDVSNFVKKIEFTHLFLALMKPSIIIRRNESGTHRRFHQTGFYILKSCKANDLVMQEQIQNDAEIIAEEIRQKIIKDCYDGNGCLTISGQLLYPDFTEWIIDPVSNQAENSAGIWCEFKLYQNITTCNYTPAKWLP